MAHLEVIAGPLGAKEPLEGHRFELARPRVVFELGSRASLPIVLPGRVTTNRHARIDRTGGEWFLSSYVSPGTWLDGELLPANAPHKLTHGAVLHLGRAGYALSFNEREPAGRSPELEAAIALAPDDAQRWLVYGDWLQERGDAWGVELVRGTAAEAPVLESLFRRSLGRMRALGPLMRAVREHDVVVRWNAFNAVSHVGLRPSVARFATDPDSACWLVSHLGDAPAARLLTSLDLGVGIGDAGSPERTSLLLDALAQGAPLSALRTLTFGYTNRATGALPAEALARLARKSPHAALAQDAVARVCLRASLRLLAAPKRLLVGELKPGAALALDARHPTTLSADKTATVRLIGLLGQKVQRGGARVAWDGECWRVHREAAPVSSRVETTFLRLNGHTVQFDEVLMPGDELEMGPGISFRFEVS